MFLLLHVAVYIYITKITTKKKTVLFEGCIPNTKKPVVFHVDMEEDINNKIAGDLKSGQTE